MTIGAELPCPSCGRLLDSLAWHDAESGSCRNCRVHFEFVGFPALNARPQRAVPKAVLVAEHATCFHHPENQAEAEKAEVMPRAMSRPFRLVPVSILKRGRVRPTF